MKEKSRIKTYNTVIKNIIESIKHIDPNSIEIIQKSKKYIKEKIKNEQENEILGKLEKEDLDKLIIAFLIEQDPSMNYLKKYETLKQERKIIPLKGDKKSYVEENTIYFNQKGNLYDFISFIHEFFHIVNNEREKNPLLNEFLSIYYEEEAIFYLLKIGYQKEECEKLKNIRRNYLYRSQKKLNTIEKHMEYRENIGEINLEYIEQEIKEEIRKYLEKKEKDKIIKYIDIEEEAKKRIDKETILLIKYGKKMIVQQEYYIAYYLTELLKNHKNRESIIKEHQNNKNKLTLEEIFEIIKEKKIKRRCKGDNIRIH